MSKTKIYIVRHCESTGNVSNRFMGRTDVDITDKGRKQLEYLSERFKGAKVDAVYSSPLKRTVLTAQAANKYLGLDIEIDERLIEIDFGVFENIPMDQIIEMDPINADYWTTKPHLFKSPGGESMQDVYNRALPALQDIAKKNPGKTVIVATHGCFIRNAICRAEGQPLSMVNSINWSHNTGVSLLEFDQDGNCNIIFKNDVSHLPEEMLATMKLVPKILRAEYKG